MSDSSRHPDAPSIGMPDDFDRALGRIHDLQSVAHTKPATLRLVPPFGIGGTALYSVTTYRQGGDLTEDTPPRRGPATFTVFLEIARGDTNTRVMLPDAVLITLLRQRDALTAKAARQVAKEAAQARKLAGWKPTPPPRRAKKGGAR